MLDKDTILKRIPELDIRLYSDGRIRIKLENESYFVDFFGLKILEIFSLPCSMSQAMDKLSAEIKGAQDWMDLTQAIVSLWKAGVLQGANEDRPTLKPHPSGFDAAYIHILMLNDQRRTQTYLNAIRAAVRPGEVVIDIGTGTGVLAVAAAQAGAGKVYAIEATGIGELANKIFAANDASHAITLVKGWSTKIDLPETADVLVSEIIGNDPFGERALEATLDARARLLKPGGKMIPEGFEVFGLPVTVPDHFLNNFIPTKESAQNWKNWYGINFDPITEFQLRKPFFVGAKAVDTRKWIRLASSVSLVTVDFYQLNDLAIIGESICEAEISGILNGVLVYFNLRLTPNYELSVDPDLADEKNSWTTLTWLLAEPLEVRPGDRFRITYTYHAPGHPDGVSVERVL